MLRTSLLLPLALILGCPKTTNTETPTQALGPVGDIGDKAIIIPAGDEEYRGSAPIWQGFEHSWRYNHRVNRLGSLISAPNTCAHTSENTLCEVQWSNAGASGSGPDSADVATRMALVSAPGVGFATVVSEVKISGTENEMIHSEHTIEVPLDKFTAEAEKHVALLNGFDMFALESADKLVDFSIQLGEPKIEGEVAKVPLTIDANMSCDSPECPIGIDEVDYSIQVGVVVIGGAADKLSVQEEKPELEYEWTADDELELGTTAVVASTLEPTPTVKGVRGFHVGLDREMHMLQMGLDVQDPSKTALQFKNWKTGMKQASPPLSWTAYREEGKADWDADVVALDIANANVIPLIRDGKVHWKGIFGPRTAEGNPKSVAMGSVTYGQRANYAGTGGDHPLERAGYGLEDLGETKGLFDPLLQWLDKGGRNDGAVAGECDPEAPLDLKADGAPARHLAQVVGLSDVLGSALQAALDADGESPPEGAEADGKVVLGANIAEEDEVGGGIYLVFEEDGKQFVVAEDASFEKDGQKVVFTGRFEVVDGGLDWNGTVWVPGMAGLSAVSGKIKLTPGDEGAVAFKANLDTPCGEGLKIEADLEDPGECASLDGRFTKATISSGRHEVSAEFDDVCDGCNAKSDGTLCFE